MTSDVKLLPLTLPSRFEFTRKEVRALAHDYARTCVEAKTEALRAEVGLLRHGNVACSQQVADLIGRAGNAEARAERLAEALTHVKEKLEFVEMVRGGHGVFADTYLIVTEALNPTAAQEGDHG